VHVKFAANDQVAPHHGGATIALRGDARASERQRVRSTARSLQHAAADHDEPQESGMHIRSFRRVATAVPAILAMLIAGLLLAGCDSDERTLGGTLSFAGGDPAADVDVRVYRDTAETLVATTTTDSEGRFAFAPEELRAGDYRVAFGQVATATWWDDANGWTDATTVHADADAPPHLSQLLASGTVSGTVTAQSGGGPVAGATIAVQAGDTTAEGRTVATISTDTAGHFTSSDLPEGRYRLLATGPGLTTRFVAADPSGTDVLAEATVVEISAGEASTGHDISLAPESALSGTVRNGHGTVEGVWVAAFDASTGAVRSSAASGADGSFRLGNLGSTGVRIGLMDPTGHHAPRTLGAPAGTIDVDEGTVFTPPEGASLSIGSAVIPGADCREGHDGVAALTDGDVAGLDLNACDLAGADLSGASLQGADLTGADLAFANLVGTDLSDAVVTGARVSGANLTRADLTRADLSGTEAYGAVFYAATIAGSDFTDVALHDVRSGRLTGTAASLPAKWQVTAGHLIGPGANLTGADLAGVDLAGADLAETNLSATNLRDAALTGVTSGGIIGRPSALPTNWRLAEGHLVGPGADLTGADLIGANLGGADLTGTHIDRARLAWADMSGVRSSGVVGNPASLPEHWDVARGYLIGPGADLDGANLAGFDFSNRYLAGIRLESADLEGADFASTDLNNATLWGASAKGVRSGGVTGWPNRFPTSDWTLSNGYLVGPEADVRGADLRGASFFAARFPGADFSGADLTDADLFAAKLMGADFTGALLDGINLGGADLTDTTFDGASLQAADLAATILFGASLANTDLTDASLMSAVLTPGVAYGPIVGVPRIFPPGWTLDPNGYLVDT